MQAHNLPGSISPPRTRPLGLEEFLELPQSGPGCLCTTCQPCTTRAWCSTGWSRWASAGQVQGSLKLARDQPGRQMSCCRIVACSLSLHCWKSVYACQHCTPRIAVDSLVSFAMLSLHGIICALHSCAQAPLTSRLTRTRVLSRARASGAHSRSTTRQATRTGPTPSSLCCTSGCCRAHTGTPAVSLCWQ